MLTTAKNTFREFPTKFWVMVVATFVDRVGGTLIFPFFALYITARFDVGMTQAGVLFAIFSVSGFFGNMLGGALTDKFGRKGMVLFGLIFSALSSLAMGFVDDLNVFFVLAAIVGFLSDIAGPARQAMIADMLPEEKRTQGFGIFRIAGNLAWIIGPTIGGFIATQSYLALFILDAVSSTITAFIVFRLVPETMPDQINQVKTSFLKTVAGYRTPLSNKYFMAYIFISILMLIVYGQMYNTLSVYLRDFHGIPPRGYGLLLSMNATLVVLLQFWVTRRISPFPPMLMMAAGAGLYMIGFSMYGFGATAFIFAVAMIFITFGEMVALPTGQALVANFAPADMRGRYMAVFGIAWMLPSAIGPWGAGLIMDNFDPRWVWYLGGIISAMAVAGFYGLHVITVRRDVLHHDEDPDVDSVPLAESSPQPST